MFRIVIHERLQLHVFYYNQEQYEFLHEALAEAFKLSDTSIPSANFAAVYSDLGTVDPVTGQPKMAAQFKVNIIFTSIVLKWLKIIVHFFGLLRFVI